MNLNRLSLFLGKPIEFNKIKIYSPTIAEVEEIGEGEYYAHYLFATFNKESILTKLFNIPETDYYQIEEEDSFDVLTSHSIIINYICSSLSFFTKSQVIFDYNTSEFYVYFLEEFDKNQYIGVINKENYREFIKCIHFVNGNKPEEEEKIIYKSERAKQMMRELQRQRQKCKKNNENSLELKDILSILCMDEGNGINIFNIHQLTLYQVYEQFERLGINYSRKTLLPAWANGNLKEGTKLPEIFIKTFL